MASTPRTNIADDVIQGLDCAICGKDALHVVHVERLPDYVECAECKSAFIMEAGGERVLYGQIAAGYPQTSQFALKQWAWIEAVQARAREERPAPEEATSPEAEIQPEAELEPTTIQPPDSLGPYQQDTVPSEWTIFDDSAPEVPAEPTPDDFSQELEEVVQESPDIPPSDVLDERLQEDPETFSEAEGTETWGAEDEAETDDADELPGFAWLGGLADEDSVLGEPDRAFVDEAAPEEAAPDEPTAVEEGLSVNDLDNLFLSDSDEVPSEPSLVESTEAASEEVQELQSDAQWSPPETDLPTSEADEEDYSDSWLNGIEIDQEPTDEPDTDIEAEKAFTHDIEMEQDADWQSADIDQDMEEESPDESWLQDETSGDIEESELAGDYERAATGFSIDDEDEDEDFFSSLRDSAAIPLESQPLEDQDLNATEEELGEPAPPSWAIDEDQEELGAMAARMQAVTTSEEPNLAEDEPFEIEPETPEEQVEQEPFRDDVVHYRETDPPPDHRHRVVVGGDHIVFPDGECVHCGRTPVKGQLAIAGTLPEGQGMGDRKPTRFQVPLCGECRDRATSLSEDARSARLQSLLFALIIGMAVLVGSLAFRLVSPGDMQLTDWFILLILFVIGFAGSAILLLSRISNYPPPIDAAYVRTTLLIPSETQGLETAFEWRSEEYAQRFYEANQSNALGNVTRVKDRLILGGSE